MENYKDIRQSKQRRTMGIVRSTGFLRLSISHLHFLLIGWFVLMKTLDEILFVVLMGLALIPLLSVLFGL